MPFLGCVSHIIGFTSAIVSGPTVMFGKSFWVHSMGFPSGGRTCSSRVIFRSPLILWDPWGSRFTYVGTGVQRSGPRTGGGRLD